MRSKRKRNRPGCFILLAAVCLGLFLTLYQTADPPQEGTQWQALDQVSLTSESAAVLDRTSGEVVYLRGDRRRAPASLTKLMTALVTVESVSDLNATASVSAESYGQLIAANAAMAGFLPDEEVSVRDLLYGLLLPSGADAAEALACFVSGSESEFVDQMNDRARELGLNDTHFANSWGIDELLLYSTAADMARLLDTVLDNETLRAILTAPHYTSASTLAHPEGLSFSSTLLESGLDLSLASGWLLGGKTGYTDNAGLCLASFAEIDGREYIVVTLGAPGNHSTSPYHIQDTIALYNAIGGQMVN